MINLLGLMISGNIPNAQWGGGQLKSSINMDKKTFSTIKLPKEFLNPICEYLYDRMLIAKGNSKRVANVKS